MKTLTLVSITIAVLLQLCAASHGGGTGGASTPPLDTTLMGMKEHGAWYFLCVAPTFPCRIPPHYLTYRTAASAVLSSAMYTGATEIRQDPVTLRLRDHGARPLVDNY